MKLITRYLFRMFRLSPSVRPRIIDLPEEWGPRMRVGEVRGLLTDPKHAAVIKAVAQLLWMNRNRAQDAAADAAATGKTTAPFWQGKVEAATDTLADLDRFMAPHLVDQDTGRKTEWKATPEMAMWFRDEAEKV